MYAKKVDEVLKEVKLTFPQEMFVELNTLEQKSTRNDEYVIIATRRLSTHKQPNQIREALMKGYVEMSHINLLISSECLHAEYEAEHTAVERLVSGG